MKRFKVLVLLAIYLLAFSLPAHAQNRYIVRHSLGLKGLNLTCLLLNCNVLGSLGDPAGQVYVITTKPTVNPLLFLTLLLNQIGVIDAEPDQIVNVMAYSSSSNTGTGPAALYDSTPINYYGTTVRHGYVFQPATTLIHLADAQSNYKTTGGGVVAVIDTGVDPAQPVLKSVLVPGYDFVNNKTSVDETADINQSTMAVLDNNNAQPGFVNQSTMAVLDQSTMAVLDGPQYAAFGHGTMVSGVIHLVAPTAQIMPLKAFTAAGTGNLSDVVRAIYFASFHGAKVINMSFDFSSSSTELKFALNTANLLGVICVASSGNDGKQISVYPASYSNVIGAASTSNIDQRSTFSNYGSQVVWVAAPGEGVVTTYPFGSYAAVWGTSFSAPMVSGTAALLVGLSHGVAQQNTAASSLAHADYINSQLNHGRLNVNTAVDSWLLYIGPK